MKKSFSFNDIQKFKNAYFPLSVQNKEAIIEELKKYGLEKYIDEVDVVIYSYCF